MSWRLNECSSFLTVCQRNFPTFPFSEACSLSAHHNITKQKHFQQSKQASIIVNPQTNQKITQSCPSYHLGPTWVRYRIVLRTQPRGKNKPVPERLPQPRKDTITEKERGQTKPPTGAFPQCDSSSRARAISQPSPSPSPSKEA